MTALTPSSPAIARPYANGRPIATALAPSASALNASAPLRIPLSNEVPRLQDLPHNRLDLLWKPFTGATPARGPGQKIRRQSLARTSALDQCVYMTARYPESGGSLIGGQGTHTVLQSKRTDDSGPPRGGPPPRLVRRQHTPICYRPVTRHQGLLMLCTRVRPKTTLVKTGSEHADVRGPLHKCPNTQVSDEDDFEI